MNENSFAAVRMRTKKLIEDELLPKDFELASVFFNIFSPSVIEYMNKNFQDWYYVREYGRKAKKTELSFVYDEYIFIISKYVEKDMGYCPVYNIVIEKVNLCT